MVTGLSNASVVFEGTSFPQPIYIGPTDIAAYGGGVASFSGNANDFWLWHYFGIDGGQYFFLSVGSSTGKHAGTTAAIYTQHYEAEAHDDSTAGWRLTKVTPVPEPETYAMLLAGLGVIGSIICRKTKRT